MPGGNVYQKMLDGERPVTPVFAEAVAILERLGYKEIRDSYQWVPTHRIYARYLGANPTLTLPLSVMGVAVRLAFPNVVRVKRRCERDGRIGPYFGWAELTGPGVEVTPEPWDYYRERRNWRADP